MTSTPIANAPLFRLAGLVLALAAATPALSQQIFRSVGPDGRITFSDKPPAATATPGSSAGGAAATPSGPVLPFAVRQAATRFPVTIYTGNACAPCASGRNLLVARGVPFNERIVGTAEDIEALQRLQGESGLPLLTIGGQQLKGFSESEWVQFLDAAGYPKTSQLPAGYRNPAPLPMVARAEAAPPPQPPAPPPLAPLTAPPAPSPANPAGIQF
ncbi:MAG: glutaredoxin family protein [Burkholderiaceae bacterium]|nr:glutaredoxin family protein [Burkholderiaceae bacterium]